MQDPRCKTIPLMWRQPITEYGTWLQAAGRTKETIATRLDHLRRAARALPAGPWQTTYEDLITWTGGQSWSRETRKSVNYTLKGFFTWGFEAGRIAENPAAKLPKVPAASPSPRPAPEKVVADALTVADSRVALMIHLAAFCGLRRAEISRIHANDLGEDLYGPTLRVHGKGLKVRNVPISNALANEILTRARGGWLFPGQDGGHISPRWAGKLMSRALPAGWTPHTLRHRFATQAYCATSDLMAVSRLLGHASVATTQRYVATEAARLRAVASSAAA